MSLSERQVRRVIGLDAHPYLFSAAALSGADALSAQKEWVVDRVSLDRLETVLKKRAQPGDVVVLEASGNSFAVAERLWAAERRELFFGYRNAVRDSVRARNRIWAFLNQQCVRRPRGLRLAGPKALDALLALRAWTPLQQLLLGEEVAAFQQAEARRRRLREEIAVEVASDPQILKMTRLLGIRDKVAFALAAFIGTIERFENPKRLVAYFGLNPRVSRSGISGGNGPLSCYGRADVRALLIQAAQSIMKYGRGPTHRWAVALKMRKGNNIAVAALARKLAVSVWYLLKGFFTPLTELTETLRVKMHKIASEIGRRRIRAMGFESLVDFERQKLEVLLQTA